MKKVVIIQAPAEKFITLTDEQRDSLKRILDDKDIVIVNFTFNKIGRLKELANNNEISAIIPHPILLKSKELSSVYEEHPDIKLLFDTEKIKNKRDKWDGFILVTDFKYIFEYKATKVN